MRKVVRILLLLFVFTIPWEYSLDFGSPFGNIARLIGMFLLVVAVAAVLREGRWRTPGRLQWLTLALLLWLCCTYFWSVAPDATLTKLRGYVQQLMIVWLAWEFVDTPEDLRNLMRAWLAGSWVLVVLSFVDFATFDPASADQIRFAPAGQDPNDVARFIGLCFPIAALLTDGAERRIVKIFAVGYFPLGFAAVLLTASRGGFVTALIALAGCAYLIFQRHPKRILGSAFVIPAVSGLAWFVVPRDTLERLGTMLQQVQSEDLNQRVNIWRAGWRAFVDAPLLGRGAGSFVTVTGLSPIDTAHNTALSILVEGGLCGLMLAAGIVLLSAHTALATRGPLRIALMTLLVALVVSSVVGTVAESRSTWLLLAVLALFHRFVLEQPEKLERAFPSETLQLQRSVQFE